MTDATTPKKVGRPSMYDEEMKPVFVKVPASFYNWMYQTFTDVPLSATVRRLAMLAANDEGYME